MGELAAVEVLEVDVTADTELVLTELAVVVAGCAVVLAAAGSLVVVEASGRLVDSTVEELPEIPKQLKSSPADTVKIALYDVY